MVRYRFWVEYLGTHFAGWQIQAGPATVQGELEKALAICLRQPITIVGAGRTDAGVHGRGQVAHFDCEQILELRKVERSINALTPESIFIRGLENCPHDFHARYSALARRYHYRIALRPTSLMGHLAWYSGYTLEVELLKTELANVIGTHDFIHFSVPREDGKSTLCEVVKAEVNQEDEILIITLEANRFLHKMVRSIVGASFDVARGAWEPGLVKQILEGKFQGERTWAPAHGLCLEKIKYAT